MSEEFNSVLSVPKAPTSCDTGSDFILGQRVRNPSGPAQVQFGPLVGPHNRQLSLCALLLAYKLSCLCSLALLFLSKYQLDLCPSCTGNPERNATTNATFFSCDQLKSNSAKLLQSLVRPVVNFVPQWKQRSSGKDQRGGPGPQAGRSRN